MKISLESDGTKAGTKLLVNGVETAFESVHIGADQWSRDIWFAYSVLVEDEANKLNVRTSYTFDPTLASLSSKRERISSDEIDMANYGKM